MKKVLILLFFNVSFCFAQQIPIDMADVPRDVLMSFIKLYPEHGDNSKWSMNEKKHYVVYTQINKHKAMIVFKDDGSFVLCNEKITIEEISDSAKTYFNASHPNLQIACCNRLKTYKNDTYEVMCAYLNNDPNREDITTYPKELPPSLFAEREFLK